MRNNRVSVLALVGGCAVAVAALVLTTDSAFASINLNSSRSNVYRTVNPRDPKAVQTCKASGGTIATDPNGRPACVTSDPNAFQACKGHGGRAGKTASGVAFCESTETGSTSSY
jgi:hypothetical protein